MLESATVGEDVGGAVFPTGVFSDGTIVVGGGFFFSSSSENEFSNGYSRRPTTYPLPGTAPWPWISGSSPVQSSSCRSSGGEEE